MSVRVCQYVGIDEDGQSDSAMPISMSIGGVNDAPVVVTSGVAIGIYPWLL